jgi:glycosyltransferase involved in cell wall biosynthesis
VSTVPAPAAASTSVVAVASDPDVTIVITCYEQEPFVASAVRSALIQTLPARVIVVDDGSTDRSAAIAERMGVEVRRRPHAGALSTFRAAVAAVETPLYILLNADDELDARYVELTRPHMDDPSVGFVYTGMQLAGSAQGTVGAPAFDVRTLRWGNYVHAASLTRLAAYESVGGFDARFADHHEDWALWVAMARSGWVGRAVDVPLLRYRRHDAVSRNPARYRDVEAARWRLFRRSPDLYGTWGAARLVGSSVRLAITGR